MPKPATHRVVYDNLTAPPILCVSVAEAGRLLGVGRSMTYELIADGELELIKIGRRSIVPYASLQKLVARRLAASEAP